MCGKSGMSKRFVVVISGLSLTASALIDPSYYAVPVVDKEVEEPPPYVVLVQGPPGVWARQP